MRYYFYLTKIFNAVEVNFNFLISGLLTQQQFPAFRGLLFPGRTEFVLRICKFVVHPVQIKPLLILTFLCICWPPTQGLAQPAEKPNFLFILVDDMGWPDLGCYGNAFNETPNIDQLAKEGMRFTNAYAASPVCSPTRASIQTGQYPARVGMNMIINPHRRPWAKLTPPANRWNLPENQPTLAEALKKAGYTSGIFGKWNLGYESPNLAHDRGYIHKMEKDALNPAYHDKINTFTKNNPDKGIGSITEQAVQFMEENKDEPFLCMVSYYSVHIPMEAREELVQKYAAKKTKFETDIHPKYAAMVEHVDESVGLLEEVLETLNIADNTVIFLFSDNGGLIQVYHNSGPIVSINTPLRSEKGTVYEGGIRVPMIVKWPGKVAPGTVSNVPVISNDFFPTMMEMAAAENPAPSPDGISLLPVLRQSGNINREALYWHYPTYHHSTPAAAMREGNYKLIKYYETGELELYNLENDIGELNNLINEHPGLAEKMQEKLHQWQASVKAGMPTPNPNYNISKAYIWGVRPEEPWMEVEAAPLPMEERCKLLSSDGEEVKLQP